MRILHITPAYLPAFRYGGPIQSVHGLCKALVTRDHNVTIATTNLDGSVKIDVPLNQEMNHEGVRVNYFDSNFFKKIYFSLSMNSFLRNNVKKFDLVHCHSLFVWPTFVATYWAKKHKIPYVISPRGMLVKELIRMKSSVLKNVWLALFDRKTLQFAAGIHATTLSEMNDIKKFNWNLPDVFMIPNGVDVPFPDVSHDFKVELSPELKNSKRILFLGRISWKKGLDRLIETLRYIQNAHVIIAGNDEENYSSILKQKAVRCGVQSHVIFKEHLASQEKFSFLRSADLLVLPSHHENFGNVVLEAMSVGCPVVVSKGVGLADMVQETGVGIVVDNDPKIMGEAIHRLLQDKEQLNKMKMLGPQVVQDRFLWSKIAEQMEQVYLKILSSKNQ